MQTTHLTEERIQHDFRAAKAQLLGGGSYSGKTLVVSEPAAIDEVAVRAAIAALDLSMIRLKLVSPPPAGLGWTEAEAVDAEKWYRMYLFLVRKYPGAYLVPNRHIDEFWHQHILDTRAYIQDCERVFGAYHHHFPYAGMLGEEDYAGWLCNIVASEQLFVREFGVEYGDQAQKCTCFGGKCKSVLPS